MNNMFVYLLLLFGTCTAVIVDTKYGKVKGYPFITRNQRQVWSFSGIRYATPPLGHLRFKDPQPPTKYNGVRDVEVTSSCIYYTVPGGEVKGEEDCLQLSVYTPSSNLSKPYPVLVWIHGGGFAYFSGQSTFGAQYFMDHDVVLVVVEFRLGILGLLSLESNVIPGNQQFKDQVLALKWVQENIAAFKGDSFKVTLMGQSSGAVGVNFHMVSPMSRGLFQAAICLSGASTVPWNIAVPATARQTGLKLATFLNCTSNNDAEILFCLQNTNVVDLIEVFKNNDLPTIFNNPLFVLLPVLDGYASHPFLPVNPHKLLSAPVPLLTGVNNLDGIFFTQVVVMNDLFQGFNQDFDKYASNYLFYNFSLKKEAISQRIRKYYFGDQPITEQQSFANITDMFSDREWFWPLLQMLKLHRGPTYVYNNAYNNSQSYEIQAFGKKILTGSAHGDTTILTWEQEPFKNLDENATQVSIQFVKMLIDFVKYRIPKFPDSSRHYWPLWNNFTQLFVTIDNNGHFRVDRGFYLERMQFWRQLHNFAPDIDFY